MKQVLVIGAGASGLMAAVTAARNGAAVTVLEGMERPGKKLLATGNGKCNLTNTNLTYQNAYRGGNSRFLHSVLKQFTVEDTLRFFEELGLCLKEKNGYIYPRVEQASAVLELFLMEARRLGIRIKCSEKAVAIFPRGGKWQIRTPGWTYEADAVILSAGSKAAPSTGSDGSGYALAAKAGHHIIKPLPALVPLKAKGDWFKALDGVRSQAKLTLYIEDEIAAVESGELQWTKYGISGIVTFQLSGYAARARDEQKQVRIVVDFMPDFGLADLEKELEKRVKSHPGRSAEEMLTGFLNKKLIGVILKKAGIKPAKAAREIDRRELKGLAGLLKECQVEIAGARDFDFAQVCSGGVPVDELDPVSMESRLARNLYLTGELVDIDGACGGYNLQWSWCSGYVAGWHCAMDGHP